MLVDLWVNSLCFFEFLVYVACLLVPDSLGVSTCVFVVSFL